MNYYNENDKFCVQWLKNLIEAGLIPKGEVDDRSITEVTPSDLKGFVQCHFFAGIGGWAYALRLAGWSEDMPVWTGSCPCQPFSQAGKGYGINDERHLWPAFRWLIAQHQPATCFGEQVASKAGRMWLTGVRSDLEILGYAVGAADLCAAGIGAPHIRQRLWWVAHSTSKRCGEKRQSDTRQSERACLSRAVDGLANSMPAGRAERWAASGRGPFAECGSTCGMGDTAGWEQWRMRQQQQIIGREVQAGRSNPWDKCQPIQCRDGKSRRIPLEPALFPLDDGVPGRVGMLRGAGNAIVPQVAAEFIMSFMEADNEA